MTWFLFYSVSTSCLQSFQYGFYISQLNSVRSSLVCDSTEPEDGRASAHSLATCIPLTSVHFAAITAFFPLGGLVGAFGSVRLSRRLGLNKPILITNILFLLAAMFMGLANGLAMLLIGRFLAGVGAGTTTTVVPVYVSHITPQSKMGFYGSFIPIFLTMGLVGASGLGLVLPNHWRIVLGVGSGSIGLVGLLLSCSLVESPVWLAQAGKQGHARAALSRLTRNSQAADKALQRLVDNSRRRCAHQYTSNGTSHEGARLGWYDLFHTKRYRNAWLILCVGMAGIQFSGINYILSYSSSVLRPFYGKLTSFYVFLITLLDFAFTIVVALIVDTLGRKSMYMVSLTCMAISHILIVALPSVGPAGTIASLSMAVVSFALGLGAIPFVLVGDLSEPISGPQLAMSGTLCNWIAQFIVLFGIRVIGNLSQRAAFLAFTGILIPIGAFMFLFLPETRGKSGDEIARELGERPKLRW